MTDIPLKEQVLAALSAIQLPDSDKSLADPDRLSSLSLKETGSGAAVRFVIAVSPAEAKSFEEILHKAETALSVLPGVASAHGVLTAHRKAPELPIKPRFIIAVASGKGGVGKSTTAVNLALAFVAKGLRVGLLDADLYGPSVPRLIGVKDHPKATPDKKILPLEKDGLVAMSMGFLVEEPVPIAWRGPMVHGALKQMLGDVLWGPLDLLVIDMPPGTGDVHLTLGNEVDFAGAIIVSTPQDIALLDAGKSLNLFRKMEVPLLGIIENMSGFVCPHCGKVTPVFGAGGAEEAAKKADVPFLGAVPLTLALRETSDAGTPIVAKSPDSAEAKIYSALADKIWGALEHKA